MIANFRLEIADFKSKMCRHLSWWTFVSLVVNEFEI
jgi:hypothetical protein